MRFDLVRGDTEVISQISYRLEGPLLTVDVYALCKRCFWGAESEEMFDLQRGSTGCGIVWQVLTKEKLVEATKKWSSS